MTAQLSKKKKKAGGGHFRKYRTKFLEGLGIQLQQAKKILQFRSLALKLLPPVVFYKQSNSPQMV